jgi:hypothetical protein
MLVVLNVVVAVLLTVVVVLLVMREPRGSVSAPWAADRQAPGVETRMPQQDVSARIIKDLLSKPELIPFEGRLGGSMGFYQEDNVYILSDSYVFARFTDGHVQGSMVLEYEMRPGNAISWRVLDATLDR